MPRSSGQNASPSRAMRLDGRSMSSRPSKRMEPRRRPTMPMIDLSVVVLPAPLRPRSVTMSPGRISKSTPWRMWDSPYQAWRSRTSSSGSGMARAHVGLDQLDRAAVQTVEHSLRPPEVERGAALALERDAHVLQYREVGEHGRDLERAHETQPGDVRGPGAGDLAALEADAPAGGRQEMGQEIEAGGLAGAVGADERVDRPTVHAQPHVLHRDEAAKLFGEPLGFQNDVVGHLRRASRRADRSAPPAAPSRRGWTRPSPTTPCTRSAPSAPPRAARAGRGGTTRGAVAWCGRARWEKRRRPSP